MLLWLPAQFSFVDLFFAPIYIFFLTIICFRFLPKNPKLIKYYKRGFYFKILGGIIFWFLYIQVYGGGDSWSYFVSAKALCNLTFYDNHILRSLAGIKIILGIIDNLDSVQYFSPSTGYPKFYIARGYNNFTVARLSSIICFISGRSFLISTILISAFSYIGIWKLYKVMTYSFPNNEKGLFYLMLAMPSLLFWGGGVMKDTYVLNATCWIVYNLYAIFVFKKQKILNVVLLIFNVILIINIKSYVVISLLPAVLIWINNFLINRISSPIIKSLVAPFIIVFIATSGFLIYQGVSESLGQYSNLESTINQAKVIQQDLLREEQYGSNSYNIGELDGTVGGMLRVAPMSIFTAIYRPLPWEVGSPMMVISAIENSILLIFTVLLIIRLNPLKFIKEILSEPLFVFSVLFTLLFGFGVGIASTNFGALVRYKIPLIPFYFTTMYLIYRKTNEKLNNANRKI